ncbi:sigma-70 family RNA polymerase sigma factor [Lysinibacter cavernae]|uniref:RNA polymerase sigma factor (Sigma-70 family) n=1 Tax=Lysinibacter cavernae TaxID=1640652 RepID=A0A7X5R2C3_9MICO|nr:sigma-70 family RNA polymerase sigma factor [Lysinibacter cavernae]NIH54137.1 RNA polymerase sigma factor (sigma-70 family) [Lysinibacter cavernae]
MTSIHGPGLPSGETDAQLLEDYRAGDESAMTALYSRYYAMAISHTYRFVGTKAEAEDIVSEAFAKVMQAIRNGKGPTASLWWYLVTAMKSVALTPRRGPEAAMAVDSEMLELLSGDEQSGPESRDEHPALMTAFRALPQRWQEVMWYRDVEGLSMKEAGEAMRISSSALGALHTRARQRFRVEYVRASAGEFSAEACQPFYSQLPEYLDAPAGDPAFADLEAHLASCEACAEGSVALTHISERFLRGAAASAPGIVGASALLRAQGIGAAEVAQASTALQPATSGASAFLSGTAAKVAVAAAGLAVVSVGAFVWMTSSTAVQPNDPIPTPITGQVVAQSEKIPTASSAPEAGGTTGDSGNDAGEPDAQASAAPSTKGRSGRLLLVELPMRDGTCALFFQPAVNGEPAYFEQATLGEGHCEVALSRADGFAASLDSTETSRLAHAARTGNYSIGFTTDAAGETQRNHAFVFEVTNTYLGR